MIRDSLPRRTVIVGTMAAAGGTIAGCLGSDDDGGGDDSEAGDGGDDDTGSGIERPDNWPDNPAFMPNPNVEGPGGEVSLAMEFSLRDNYRAADEFETFEVDFEQVVLHQEGGDTVEVPVERTVDFYEFELGTDIILVFDAAIPAGTYTDADFHMEGSEIVHEDHGDITDDFERPERATFIHDRGSGDPLEMEAGEQWAITAHQLWVRDDPGLQAGTALGSYSISAADMTDPQFFAEDE